MTVPKRIDEFDHREFRVVLAQVGSRFRAVARDARGEAVVDMTRDALDDVKSEVKHQLNLLSQDFVSINSAINLFYQVFPDGFDSAFYEFYEKSYKLRTAEFVADKLGKDRLAALLDDAEFTGVAAVAKQALSTSNLSFANEQIKLSAALKDQKIRQPFAAGLYNLLYGDFGPALSKLASLLKPHDAAKWPILTFWPFFRFPERHMFMKPTIVQACAERMGFELSYGSMPTEEIYQSLLEFTQFLRKGLADLKPKDNIDLQTFMYVVGKDGYVRDAVRDRQAWETATRAGG